LWTGSVPHPLCINAPEFQADRIHHRSHFILAGQVGLRYQSALTECTDRGSDIIGP
jgi:hypothetical protein